MNWSQLEKVIPFKPITITMNKAYGSGGAGGNGSYTGAGGGGGGMIPPIVSKGNNGRSVIDQVHKIVSSFPHTTDLPQVWPSRYYVIANSERIIEHLRHEHGLSPLEIHPAHDISRLCGLDRSNNWIILGPGFLDSALFRGSFQSPLAILNELYTRFGDHLIVYKGMPNANW